MKRLFVTAGFLVAVVAAIGPRSAGASAKHDEGDATITSSDAGNGLINISVVISELDDGVKFKDIHFIPASGEKFAKAKGTDGAGGVTGSITTMTGPGGTQNWSVHSDGGGITVNTTGGAGFGVGTVNFQLKFPSSANGLPVTYRLTKNGTEAYDPAQRIDDGAGKVAPNLPQSIIDINGGVDMTMAIGTTCPIAIATRPDWLGSSYEIYLSRQIQANCSDSLGIGLETSSYPVPSGWSITSSNLTGTINYLGEASSTPSLTIPNNGALVDEIFYMVVVVKDGSGNPLFISDAIRVTFVP